jgi:hypothetical protein
VAEQLHPAVEEQLAGLSDEDWRSLSARVRPPTSSEQLKSIAAKHIPEDQLKTFMAIANVKAFADENGNIDEAKVQHASTLFGAGARKTARREKLTAPSNQSARRHRPRRNYKALPR